MSADRQGLWKRDGGDVKEGGEEKEGEALGTNAVFTGGVWNLARVEVRNRFADLPVSGCEYFSIQDVDEPMYE